MGMVSSKQAAKKFREYWTLNRPGSERSGCQQYWNMLLGELLGQTELERIIRYEVPVHVPTAPGTKHQAPSTKFLDAWIPSTRVLIEHKSRGVKLDAPQPGHDNMTPFEQAKFYDDHRAFDEKARWIVTCNFDEIWIYDQTKPLDPPEKIALATLPKEVHRLSFLVNASVKKVDRRELEISVQAGKIVGTLYDALLKQYAEPDSPETLKALNKLCVRLVFCFYAEDADIFDKNLFRKLVSATPAANLRRALLTLFDTLDTPIEDRDKYLEPEFAAFPYTNGGLFKGATEMEIPPLTEEIRNLLIGSSDFDWSGIDTTIFGALFESTLNPETRRAGGMVYTSSENIHKLIDPLFLDDLEAQFREITVPDAPSRRGANRTKQLLALQDHIASLTFLDPACGSGNFLTETYTSLRRLENKIITTLQDGQSELDLGLRVKVSIDQFHGIEINDFAVTVAQTAMWISEAKMLRETADILHRSPDFLPLKSYNGIVEGNALRMDWSTLLHRTGCVPEARFNYIIGNPPFVGHQYRSRGQAADMDVVFADIADTNYGKLDYVCAWFKKSMEVMEGTPTRAAFVSTNSICQGESVAAMWRPLFEMGLVIDFAWRTFRWDNESFDKAHVHCVIIGYHFGDLATKGAQRGRKVIFDGEKSIEAKNINGYLFDASNVFIQNRGVVHYPWLPKMSKGSQPTDGGNLILSPSEREEIILSHPEAAAFILQYLGSEDFINSRIRYCLWLKGVAPNLYRSIPEVMRRLEAVAEMRRKSPTKSVQRDAEMPMLFTQIRQPATNYLAIPEVSSERRKYVPIGFLTSNVIASSKLYIVPNATLWMFGVLTSIVHMAWMRIVCGRLKSDYSYSPAVYNNFPWPSFAKAAEDKTDRDKVVEFLCGEPVARLTGHEFEGINDFRALKIAIHDSYARVNWLLHRTDIGDIHLTRSGVNDSLHHGFGRAKLSAFAAIPEIIMSGRIVRHSLNWKDRGYNSFVLVAPIEIGGEPYCAFAIVNSIKGGGFRFYLHEVASISAIGSSGNEKSGGIRTGFSDCSALSRTPGSMRSLAFSIFGVKGSARQDEVGRDAAAVIEKTAQGILDARALYPDSSLADLYDPLTMPPELRKAHAANDAAVLKAYGWPTDLSEPEIVSRLFDMYAKMTGKGTDKL